MQLQPYATKDLSKNRFVGIANEIILKISVEKFCHQIFVTEATTFSTYEI